MSGKNLFRNREDFCVSVLSELFFIISSLIEICASSGPDPVKNLVVSVIRHDMRVRVFRCKFGLKSFRIFFINKRPDLKCEISR